MAAAPVGVAAGAPCGATPAGVGDAESLLQGYTFHTRDVSCVSVLTGLGGRVQSFAPPPGSFCNIVAYDHDAAARLSEELAVRDGRARPVLTTAWVNNVIDHRALAPAAECAHLPRGYVGPLLVRSCGTVVYSVVSDGTVVEGTGAVVAPRSPPAVATPDAGAPAGAAASSSSSSSSSTTTSSSTSFAAKTSSHASHGGRTAVAFAAATQVPELMNDAGVFKRGVRVPYTPHEQETMLRWLMNNAAPFGHLAATGMTVWHKAVEAGYFPHRSGMGLHSLFRRDVCAVRTVFFAYAALASAGGPRPPVEAFTLPSTAAVARGELPPDYASPEFGAAASGGSRHAAVIAAAAATAYQPPPAYYKSAAAGAATSHGSKRKPAAARASGAATVAAPPCVPAPAALAPAPAAVASCVVRRPRLALCEPQPPAPVLLRDDVVLEGGAAAPARPLSGSKRPRDTAPIVADGAPPPLLEGHAGRRVKARPAESQLPDDDDADDAGGCPPGSACNNVDASAALLLGGALPGDHLDDGCSGGGSSLAPLSLGQRLDADADGDGDGGGVPYAAEASAPDGRAGWHAASDTSWELRDTSDAVSAPSQLSESCLVASSSATDHAVLLNSPPPHAYVAAVSAEAASVLPPPLQPQSPATHAVARPDIEVPSPLSQGGGAPELVAKVRALAARHGVAPAAVRDVMATVAVARVINFDVVDRFLPMRDALAAHKAGVLKFKATLAPQGGDAPRKMERAAARQLELALLDHLHALAHQRVAP